MLAPNTVKSYGDVLLHPQVMAEHGLPRVPALRCACAVRHGRCPVTTGPDHEPAPARGHLRAAHADRERAITILKAAFVQGRLTKDELESRAARAFTAKTYADLATLTADIPPAPATGSTAPAPASTPARTLERAARRSGVCLLTTLALIAGAILTGNAFFLVLAFFAFIAASGFIGYGIIDARQERRSRDRMPSRPDLATGLALAVRPAGSAKSFSPGRHR
jgi:hypothetical protein